MTQNHATNNREVDFLESVKNSLTDKQKLHFPTIISNGLIEINDPLILSKTESKYWSYIILEMLGDTV